LRRVKRIPGLGLILVILKNLLSIIADSVVKKIENIDSVSLIFYRSLIMLIITMTWSIVKDQPPFPSGLSRKDRALQVVRCLISGVHVMAAYFALQQMPLSVQKLIISARPIFTVILARVFLKEPFGKIDVVTILLMIPGLILVIQPPFIFPEVVLSEGYKDMFLLASILLVISTIVHSNVSVIKRYLRKIPIGSMNSSREVVLVITSFLFIYIGDINVYAPSWSEKLKLVFFGCSSVIQVTLGTLALRFEKAGPVSIVDRSSAILIAIVSQIIFFEEIPNTLAIGGLTLVTLAVLVQGAKKLDLKLPKFLGKEKKANRIELSKV